MNSTVLIVTLSLVMSVLLVNAEDDGRYHAEKYSQNAGKYIPMNDRTYHHVHDRRELGRYVHVHIPYTGGYGPYDHMPNPYLHEGVPYIHDGDYEHVSSSSEYHPYNEQGYEIPKPEIPLVYGFPNIPLLPSSPKFPESTDTETNLLLDTPTTTDATSSFFDSTTILTGDSLNSRKKRSLFHSQPKTIEITSTTTTARPTRPRTRYDDEGKWRIIRQEENKQQKKYDYFFETENKIFAQEAGKVSGKEKEGTSGIGWYQYVGDDGKVYRVEYEAGEQGFVPKGDHIHKSIQKHLNSLKERNLI
ncbi:uncharacterized protein LOC116352146 isoform X2 [Contarinia nasturtii]|uniref:uncharacterized protein LOC116352146 isoform X2 n=1 Tax=Contarinia nasturtii TaxID=265458 RepID=UPI0012D499D7|nr:uncharacterized protein LOC116352146 isoform X2 [Contarinia nasturtii]